MASASLGKLIAVPVQHHSVLAGMHLGQPTVPTIGLLCASFLASKQQQFDCGELVLPVYKYYRRVCDRLIDSFGESTPIEALTPFHFAQLRSQLAVGRGPHALGREIIYTRCVFKYGYDVGLLDRPIRFGPDFKKPPAKLYRKAKREGGSRMFEAAEIHRLLELSSPLFKALILLGVNCGFGNDDVAELLITNVDLNRGWVSLHRKKTETLRSCPLWPETLAAIRGWLVQRPKSHLHWLFLGRTKRKLCRYSIIDAFRRFMAKAGITRPQQGFYGLRRTFRTIADETGDHVAAALIMGHLPDQNDMGATYRQRVNEERLTDVAEHVRGWLFPQDETKKFDQCRAAAQRIRSAWEQVEGLTSDHLQIAVSMLGLSQVTLARAIGQTQSHVNSIIRGRRQITEETEARLRHAIHQLASGQTPQAIDDVRPIFETPADVPLSDEALASLARHPFTSSDLNLFVDQIRANGVQKQTLAAWWGFHPSMISAFLREEKPITFRAAERLRQIFAIPCVLGAKSQFPLPAARIPATPEILRLFASEPFGANELTSLLEHLRNEFAITKKDIAWRLGIPAQAVYNQASGKAAVKIRSRLRNLFAT